MLAVAVLAAAASWPVLRPGWTGAGQAVVAVVLLVVVLRSLSGWQDDRRALRRATARERVLGDLGTALTSATDTAEVHRLAVRAAGALLAEHPGARASILDAATLTAVDAASAEAGTPTAADAGTLAAVEARALAVAEAADAGADAMAVADRSSTLLPLIHHDRRCGVLTVSARTALPAEVLPSLEALRTQVAATLASVALAAELTERATRDPLTGLGNRAMLDERLTTALARARRTGRPVGALLLDLTGFKQVNEVHGHAVGDELLRVVAQRLRDCVRTEDLAGRLVGDEFVVVAEDLTSARDVTVIAERIFAALAEPIEVGRRRLCTPAAVGIALSHADVTGPEELLRMAGAAMAAAERRGGGCQLYGAAEPVPALS